MFEVSEEDRGLLLTEARETISAELDGRPPRYAEKLSAARGASVLGEPCGAFVSLHLGEELRGCIGRMAAVRPLRETVRSMARSAAFEDPRFPPLSRDELPRCHIEISVLSPMVRCADPDSVAVGVHGLYLTYHGRSGVLLPQVPVEQGWDLQAYLDYICRKAGVPPASYREADAELYTFTATVFSEKRAQKS
jgi:uncharacterized protein